MQRIIKTGMQAAVFVALAVTALALPASTQAASFTEIKKLTALDASAHARFGFSVAVDQNIAVIGARYEGPPGANLGAVYIFERDEGGSGNWGEVKKLTASDGLPDDRLGASVAISGTWIVAGADGEDDGGFDAGAAYVFERDHGGPGNWGEVAKLTASDAGTSDRFGLGSAISGDTIVVGARDENAAYVYQRDQGGPDNWGEVKKLTAPASTSFGQLGLTVALSGDTAIVGGNTETAGGFGGAGAAYIFERDQDGTDNWGLVTRLVASDVGAIQHFGYSVTIDGDTAIVGANGDDAGGAAAGAAYVFERDAGGSGNWGEVTKLTASDAEPTDWFGISVAVSGDGAVVGASFEDAEGNNAGGAYVFDRNEGGPSNWGEVAKLTASDGEPGYEFGWDVAMSSGTPIIGSWLHNGEGFNAGAAYVFGDIPPAVGGVSLPSDISSQPLAAPRSTNHVSGVLAWAIAAAAGGVALGGAAWYTRRR